MKSPRGLALCIALVACMWAAAGRCTDAPKPLDAGAAVAADLEFRVLIAQADATKLQNYYQDLTRPDVLRARALRAIFRPKAGDFTADERVRLIAAMADRGSAVRIAAIQIIGQSKDQSLARQVLQIAAEDADTGVRVEAIRSARPWTRLSHLYFLETALNAESQEVRAEAVLSLGELQVRELSPALVEQVLKAARSDSSSLVRMAALDTLHAWRRLNWEMLRGMILDVTAPESLRVRALELSDDLPEAVQERPQLLVDLVGRESSVALAWGAFQRAKHSARNDRTFTQGLSTFLSNTGQRNAATEEIATFLRTTGLRVDYSVGVWSVVGKQ